MKISILGYQDKGNPKLCKLVNAATKAYIRGRNEPVILAQNNSTLIEDDSEFESLCVPFLGMKHGVKFDMTPIKFGGKGGMYIEQEFFPFEFDDEKLFFNIQKPTKEDLDTYEWFELNSHIMESNNMRRKHEKLVTEDIPIQEWRKRLGMQPENIVEKTLENTTQHYMRVECESRDDPRRHIRSRAPGLRCLRQKETVATDTLFPSIISDRGNTCLQFFCGVDSDRWEVYPLKKESNNHEALQDYCRQIAIPNTLRSDNAKSEISHKWIKHCRDYCIKTEYTEPNHPQQNPAECRVSHLNRMVRQCLKAFNAPIGLYDWCVKWVKDVHNVSASHKLNWKTPNEYSFL